MSAERKLSELRAASNDPAMSTRYELERAAALLLQVPKHLRRAECTSLAQNKLIIAGAIADAERAHAQVIRILKNIPPRIAA